VQADTGAANNYISAISAQGVITKSQPAFSNLSGSATCAQLPALTGDTTSSAGSCATTLANIPTATPAAGSIVHTNIAAPASPAAGKDATYSDSTDLRFHDKNASGIIGTTVVADTGAANNYISAISAAGVISKSRPACATLSDSANVALYNNGSKTWGGGSAFTWTMDGGANTDPTMTFTSGVTPAILANGPWQGPIGTKTLPAFAVVGSGGAYNSGMFQTAGGVLGFSHFGSEVFGDYNGQFLLVSTGQYCWTSNALDNAADLCVQRDASNTWAQKNGNSDQFSRLYGANGGYGEHGVNSELITLATGAATTDSSANLLPANSIIQAVACRITTTITTAANWSLGDATTSTRFAAANSTLTVNTTSVGLKHMQGSVASDAAGPVQTAAAKLRITLNANPGAGALRCEVHYVSFTAPTS
jgi:hypothetical protein